MISIVVHRSLGNMLGPSHEWVAITDDYEPGQPLYHEAHGASPKEALDELVNIIDADVFCVLIRQD